MFLPLPLIMECCACSEQHLESSPMKTQTLIHLQGPDLTSMKPERRNRGACIAGLSFSWVLCWLLLAENSLGQPAAPPGGKSSDAPAPAVIVSPGLINEWLRERSPAFTPW